MPASTGSEIDNSNRFRRNTPVAIWLLACCVMVFCMVVVGGATRLTRSGLSITEWQPILGALPPLSAADWQEAFEKYQLTPEYRQVNAGMSMEAFKGIFWWEYFHRLLGRTIGVAFLLPLIWFWVKKQIHTALAWQLAGIFVLGGLQGAMGWYMVTSGLVDDPRVSQFRLTAHLLLAFAIFAAMFWTALSLLHSHSGERPAPQSLHRLGWCVTVLVIYMITTGGFVAGIRAGFAYNTFPLMNGHFMPPEIWQLDPWWKNFFYNMATAQFDHRLGAWLLAVLVPVFWWRAHAVALAPRQRHAGHWLLALLVLQITLGISTLLLQVPVALAAAHQGGAVLLFAAALNANHALRGHRKEPAA